METLHYVLLGAFLCSWAVIPGSCGPRGEIGARGATGPPGRSSYGCCGGRCPARCDFYADLKQDHIGRSGPGIRWKVPLSGRGCDARGVLELTPPCEATELTIDMCLEDPTDYTFNIGDSPSNDGHGGDYETTTGEAEMHNRWKSLHIWRNNTLHNYPALHLATFRNGVTSGPYTIKIGKPTRMGGYIGVKNYAGIDVHINEPTLFVWDKMYIGINRSIFTSSRSGSGLCSLCIRWDHTGSCRGGPGPSGPAGQSGSAGPAGEA